MANTHLYILSHKIPEYGIPDNDFITPIQVGTEYTKKDLFKYKDNTLDNIGYWNPLCIEFTGTYWIWKNLTSKPDYPYKYVGQMQYRRRYNLSEEEINEILDKYLCICTSQQLNWGDATDIYSHYKECHYIEDLELAMSIVSELYPDIGNYIQEFFKYEYLCFSAGLICPVELYNEYVEFIYTIDEEFKKRRHLETIEDVRKLTEYRIDTIVNPYRNNDMNYQMGILGFINERLMTLFLIYKSMITNKEIRIIPYEIMDTNPSNYIYKS